MRREPLRKRTLALLDRLGEGGRDERARTRLVRAVIALQAERIPAVGRMLAGAGEGEGELPALPTETYRYARIACHEAEADVRVFRTSGTTYGLRGVHAFADLGLYDRAAQLEARRMLFPDRERMRLLLLSPRAREASDSSLAYMLARFCDWFGTTTHYGLRDGTLDVDSVRAFLREAERLNEPVALLGTSFAFVHLDDALGDERFGLPEGSRIMQTGGFKGRSRTIEAPAMRAMLVARYGLPESHVVSEYGMTELSSQMYESTLRDALRGHRGKRRYLAPGWVRAVPVHPETLAPVEPGEVGLLRIEDLANLDSCVLLQTADLAREVGDGFELLGRAGGAQARGCSLALDELLGGTR